LFATGVADTSGKFAAGVIDTGGNLPPVSTTLLKLVAKFAAGVVDTGGKFATGVVDTSGKIAAGVVEKIRNGLTGILRVLGETDSRKNQKQKIS
jgi:hypothetical protein